MSVAIVTASETDVLVSDLVASLSDITDDVQVINPETYLKNCAKTNYLIKVLVVSESLLRVTKNLQRKNVMALFEQRESTVVLLIDSTVDSSIRNELLESEVDWSSVHEFDASKLGQAEEVIKDKLILNAEGNFTKRYFIHPQSVSDLSGTEVMVVLGEDVNSSTQNVTVHFHGRKIEATKKQANVWMFNIDDMKPGVKLFRVVADKVDLGQNKLIVLSTKHVAEKTMKELRDKDARDFLADLLCLNVNDFDLELADILGGSSCIQLVENILKYGEFQGNHYPTLLHLCARFGLQGTLDWCRRTRVHKSRLSTRDVYGKTAEQVAKEAQPDSTFFQKFQDDGSNFGDLEEPLQSRNPGSERSFEVSQGYTLRSSCPELHMRYQKRPSYRDSGRSSSSSIVTPPHNPRGSTRKRLPSDPGAPLTLTDSIRRFDFSETNRVERPYDEISDRDLTSTIYSRPWEESLLAADISALSSDNSPLTRSSAVQYDVTLPSTSENTQF